MESTDPAGPGDKTLALALDRLADELYPRPDLDRYLDPKAPTPETFANWYMERLAQIDAAEELVKAQAKALLNRLGAARKALAWRHAQPFREAVDTMLAQQRAQGDKRRSVETFFGRAGYRKAPQRLEVENPEQAITWATAHLPDALKVDVSTSKLLAHVKATGELPDGCAVVGGGDNFYPSVKVDLAALDSGERSLLLERAESAEGDPANDD